MRTVARAGLTLGFLCATAGSLAAQTVRGTVVLRDSTPATGVIVVATDDRGRAATRTLTTTEGGFLLQLPAPGRFTLELLRIGYRPTRGPVVDIAAGATQTLRLVFDANPVVLSTVNVSVRETCRVSADTGLMVTQAWEEARKAMLSTQLSTDGAPLVAEWIEFDRTLDSAGRRVRDQKVRTQRHPTTHAFRSQPAETLHAKGYVVSDDKSTTFYAPDADVLLSELFASAHCFRLENPPADRASLIGIGFTPAADRRDVRDIEGTLWLDRASAELRTLEFRYTNLPDAAQSAAAGGQVDFLRLDDGNWLVSRWSVRMPRLEAERVGNLRLKRMEVSGTKTVLRSVAVTGGEVTRIMRRDSTIYELPGSEVLVQVLQRDTLNRASLATITLDGTDYSARANADGFVQLWPVLSGRYRAHVTTEMMVALGMPPLAIDVQARSDSHVDTLTLPASRTIVELQVIDTRGNPVQGATLQIQRPNGAARTVTTDQHGRTSLDDIAPGEITVNARKLGYQPGSVRLDVEAGRNAVPLILSQVATPMLDTVRVVGSAPTLARHLDFETRRMNHTATFSMNAAEIEQRNSVSTWQLLMTAPGMRIVDQDTLVVGASTRSYFTNFSGKPCYLRVAVDGVVIQPKPGTEYVDLRDLPAPSEIHGIEVFAGPSSIPLQYAGYGKWCGLIAIWTK